MNHVKLIALGAALLGSSAFTAQAQEIHVIMCGGEVFEADQRVADAFEASHDGVTVKIDPIPWGTCSDKATTLAAAGDPVSMSYMGSRALKQLAANDLIVPVTIPDAQKALYQPGILATVTDGGKTWGFPHAFSTKALYMNCDVIEAAGQACEGPQTWDELYNLAKAVTDHGEAAGMGLAAKDFDNTQHQFLNYLFSNGGEVIDADTGEILLDSPETVESA